MAALIASNLDSVSMDAAASTSQSKVEIVKPAATQDNGPVPMSFPAVLRNPGLADRFAHLRIVNEYQSPHATAQLAARKNRRDEKEGKRWIRRKENGEPSVTRSAACA